MRYSLNCQLIEPHCINGKFGVHKNVRGWTEYLGFLLFVEGEKWHSELLLIPQELVDQKNRCRCMASMRETEWGPGMEYVVGGAGMLEWGERVGGVNAGR